MARAVTRTATAYFPTRLEFEDEEAYLRAVRNEEACVIGLEPHGVLPLSVISFAEYFMHDDEGARRRGLTPAARRGARALASMLKVNTALRDVDLTMTGITNEGAEALLASLEEESAAPQLVSMQLKGNTVGKEVLEDLTAALDKREAAVGGSKDEL